MIFDVYPYAAGFIDEELERLREEFGEQRDLFAQFERNRVHIPGRQWSQLKFSPGEATLVSKPFRGCSCCVFQRTW